MAVSLRMAAPGLRDGLGGDRLHRRKVLEFPQGSVLQRLAPRTSALQISGARLSCAGGGAE